MVFTRGEITDIVFGAHTLYPKITAIQKGLHPDVVDDLAVIA